MRIRFSIELHIDRERESEQEQFEHRDNDGTLIIHQDQPRYIGFQRDDQRDD